MNVRSVYGPRTAANSLLFPNSTFQASVTKQTLTECGLSSKDASFIENDGLGIKDTNAWEAKAILLILSLPEIAAPLF